MVKIMDIDLVDLFVMVILPLAFTFLIIANRLDGLDEKIGELKNRIDSLDGEIMELKSRINKLDEEIMVLENKKDFKL